MVRRMSCRISCPGISSRRAAGDYGTDRPDRKPLEHAAPEFLPDEGFGRVPVPVRCPGIPHDRRPEILRNAIWIAGSPSYMTGMAATSTSTGVPSSRRNVSSRFGTSPCRSLTV